MPSETRFHRPVRLSTEKFERYQGAGSPEDLATAAQASARALLSRGRANEDPSVTKRLVHYTDEFGIEAVAELWSRAAAVTIAGALWRIYALRGVIRANSQLMSHYYERGMHSSYLAQALAGVPSPPTANEICATVDAILAGAYTGDFDVALNRFAAFCRVLALGQDDVALELRHGQTVSPRGGPPHEATSTYSPSAEVRDEAAVRATRLRSAARKLTGTARELEEAALNWRAGTLD
ncbi:MAG: histone acetyltransferase [Rothia sp. (in: high G+C Gram-positive bacteria)]|nr:histone acetyltransferase [Rothia sp. (in: high G+C Gram-positive bacteria)]